MSVFVIGRIFTVEVEDLLTMGCRYNLHVRAVDMDGDIVTVQPIEKSRNLYMVPRMELVGTRRVFRRMLTKEHHYLSTAFDCEPGASLAPQVHIDALTLCD